MDDDPDDLDIQAMQLSEDARCKGFAMFSLRALECGNVRLIGPQLDRGLVVQMLRSCADNLEAGAVAGYRVN